jgi:hypothetical protein
MNETNASATLKSLEIESRCEHCVGRERAAVLRCCGAALTPAHALPRLSSAGELDRRRLLSENVSYGSFRICHCHRFVMRWFAHGLVP